MFNNIHIVNDLGKHLDFQTPQTDSLVPLVRQRTPSQPCLPERLPSSGFIQREANFSAPRAILRQLRRSPSPPSSVENDAESPDDNASPSTEAPPSPTFSLTSTFKSVLKPRPTTFQQGRWKEPQPYEVFRAVEQKNLMLLMELRDRSFPLLLRKTGDATPLLHAMRIGQSHRDVAIVLLGAFSRWINHLQDDEIKKPQTRVLLKALRANLKLAIDYGLAKSQSDLIASFMQTLVMSEGEKWVRDQTANVSLALRAGTAGKPVNTASSAVRRFATKELGRADLIAALEDYVANATVDLLMLAAWSWVAETLGVEPIPTYYFARDDRVYKAYEAGFDKHHNSFEKLNRRLRWQLRVLKVALEGRSTTYRRKVELLMGELDEGEGV